MLVAAGGMGQGGDWAALRRRVAPTAADAAACRVAFAFCCRSPSPAQPHLLVGAFEGLRRQHGDGAVRVLGSGGFLQERAQLLLLGERDVIGGAPQEAHLHSRGANQGGKQIGGTNNQPSRSLQVFEQQAGQPANEARTCASMDSFSGS